MRIYDRIVQCTRNCYKHKGEESILECEKNSDDLDTKEEKVNPCKYVTYECQHILFLSSFQLSISLIFSFYCKFYHLALVNTGLFLTSIIHWRKPELGIRRTVDMAMALMNFLSHAVHSFNINSQCFFVCLFGGIIIAILYLTGKKFSCNSYSTLYHLLLHTTGNMSALTIYYISKDKMIDHS
ncbi:hypothetical protein, conserved [Plasmodium gonderi]|uniref:Uncharacterized protein n=1 Tax=Plasmodium gonderi TaxID=77519 RepID=A0A1Y1JB84_PLAGO|nr:hypothetical protein, conserved [Plasmodium gonderi]GAW78948.1 hypothetical protein, conserved [Plasmodium gonderi]